MSRNDEVAALLEEFADLLDATGVEYKPTAYRRAAENVREHTAPIENLVGEGEDAVSEIDRVGDAIATKIDRRILRTGRNRGVRSAPIGASGRHGGVDCGGGRWPENGWQPL